MKVVGVTIRMPRGVVVASADGIPPVFWRYALEHPQRLTVYAE